MDIVQEVRDILRAAKPANNNRLPNGGDLRPASQEKINALLRELTATRPIARTFERPGHAGRMVLHPAPYQRMRLKSGDA